MITYNAAIRAFLSCYLLNMLGKGVKSPLFQTAWFLESLSTQTLVIFVIRTRKTPFYKSKPSGLLLFSSLSVTGVALIIPFTPLGALFGFVEPPFAFLIILAGLIGVYLMPVEIVLWATCLSFGKSFHSTKKSCVMTV